MIHEENLRNLAALLKSGDKRLEFGMSDYSKSSRQRGNLDYEEETCNSIGCAIGWNTLLIPKQKGMGYTDYSGWYLIGNDSNEWDWCFAGTWVKVDNTPEGAALRIEWLLDKGLPEDWEAQMNGEVELCYK